MTTEYQFTCLLWNLITEIFKMKLLKCILISESSRSVSIDSSEAHNFLARSTDVKWYQKDPDFQSYYRYYSSIGHVEGVGFIHLSVCLSCCLTLFDFYSWTALWDWQDPDAIPADASLGADLRHRRLQLPSDSRSHFSSSNHQTSTSTHRPSTNAVSFSVWGYIPVQPHRPTL